MRKELPINLNIPYSGMIRDRNRLIAILSDSSNQTWYAENFIPLLLYPNGNIHCYDSTNFYEIFNLYDQVIETKSINQTNAEAVKREIGNNRYVIALVDEYYLCGCVYYQSVHKHQEILVYGYDDQNETFLFHGSQIDKKDYGCGDCSYADFEAALLSTCEKITEIESDAWRVMFGHPLSCFQVKLCEADLNIRKIYYHFSNLAAGKTIVVSHNQNIETFYAGSSIFDEMIKRFWQIRNGEKHSYERSIWCIKLLAGYFTSYKDIFALIREQYGIDMDSDVGEMVEAISKEVMSVYALLQKYVVTEKSRNIDRAIETIFIVKDKSGIVWERVSTSLRKYLIQEPES